MVEHRFGPVLELGDDALCENFAKLNPPLIEGINVPNGALGEDGVLVKSYQFAQRFWSKPLRENRVGWTVAFEDPVRNQPVRRALRLNLLGSLTEGQRFGLRKNIGQQHVVLPAKRIQRLGKRNEVTGDEPRPLVDQLVKRVLSVGARFPPVDRTSVPGDSFPLEGDVFSVALHR